MNKGVGMLLAVALILAVVASLWLLKASSLAVTNVTIGSTTFKAEIADNSLARQKGLSGRPGLAPDGAMLFVFESDGLWSFWMNNMQFSIDTVWLDSAKRVVHIEPRMSPGAEAHSFKPRTPARYVLELPAGTVERHNITVGSYAEF